MKLEEMQEAAEQVSDLMKVLSNKNRLMILCQLVDGEKSVGELAERLGARTPAMSQQLALLRKDGLVRPRREGQTVHYALARSDVSKLMAFLYETYCGKDADSAGTKAPVPPGGQSPSAVPRVASAADR